METIATIFLAVAGVALLLVGLVDTAWTTTAVSEFPGPLTRLLGTTLWRGLRRVTSRAESPLLRSAGSLVALTVVAGWVFVLWLGWTLVFASVPGSVVHAETDEIASFAGKIYYTAATLVTTGVGDFVPSHDGWRLLAGLVSVSGLALVTLIITYLVPVISGAVERVRTAQYVSALGGTPDRILLTHWDGATFDAFVRRVPELTQKVVNLRADLLAYPVLHFFHGADPERALAPRVAALDEAVTVLEHGLEEDQAIPSHVLLPLREALDVLLHTVVNQTFARPRDEVPPPPDLEELHGAGVRLKHRVAFEERLGHVSERRRRLFSYVRDDSWAWSNVYEHRRP